MGLTTAAKIAQSLMQPPPSQCPSFVNRACSSLLGRQECKKIKVKRFTSLAIRKTALLFIVWKQQQVNLTTVTKRTELLEAVQYYQFIVLTFFI